MSTARPQPHTGCRCACIATLQELSLQPPPPPRPPTQAFSNYYTETHSGRKLTWQTNMGSAELKAEFDARRHELTVSTQQMCVLLLFNEADSLAYPEIAAATGIPPAELRRALQSLACVKGKNPLRKEPAGRVGGWVAGFGCGLRGGAAGTAAAQGRCFASTHA